MSASTLDVGTIVLHPKRPDWGPGKVLAILAGGIAVVYFRDIQEDKRGDAVKKISTRYMPLEVAPGQTDPLLDNLPLWTEKKGFKGQKRPRLSFEAAVKGFIDEFPKGFDDPEYIGVSGGEGERAYKMAMHDRWQASFGEGRLRWVPGFRMSGSWDFLSF